MLPLLPLMIGCLTSLFLKSHLSHCSVPPGHRLWYLLFFRMALGWSPQTVLQQLTRPLVASKHLLKGGLVCCHSVRLQGGTDDDVSANPHVVEEWADPIALCKGKRKCTLTPRYPLSHFFSYDQLSLGYQSFLAGIDDTTIPPDMC